MITKRTGILCVLIVTALVTSPGCGRGLKVPGPSLTEDLGHLQRDMDLLPPFDVPETSAGSLWTDAGPGAALARDTRAYRINDLVTIVLQESSSGTNQATTDLKRESETQVGASVLFGAEKVSPQTGSFSWDPVLSSDFSTDFAGDGSTVRRNRLTGSITSRVMRVLPNGDLVIAGQKTVMVNRERQILTLVGTIRPVDVNARNQVASATVGDLTVRLWGRGEIDATVRQGWFMRVLNRLWPF